MGYAEVKKKISTMSSASSSTSFDGLLKGYWYRAKGRNCRAATAATEAVGCGDWSILSTPVFLNRPPVFTAETYDFTVSEDATVDASVGTVTAIDRDAGQTTTYTITGGNGDGKFKLDISSGQITVKSALDYETTSSYALTVTAKDGSGGKDTATVNIAVTDVAETPSVAIDSAFVGATSVLLKWSVADVVASQGPSVTIKWSETRRACTRSKPSKNCDSGSLDVSGLSESKSEISGLNLNTGYEFKVVLNYTVAGNRYEVESAAETISTHPVPNVVTLDGVSLANHHPLPDFKFNVMTAVEVEIKVPRELRSSYNFTVNAPSKTGFQIAKQKYPACQWRNITRAETKDLGSRGRKFSLVRCNRGDGVSKLTIKAENPVTGDTITYYEMKVIESWHLADHELGYQVINALPTVSKPSQVTSSYSLPSQTDVTTAINNSAAIWSGTNSGSRIWSRTNPSPVTVAPVADNPDLEIRGYWRPGPGEDDVCGATNALACTKNEGTYPDLGNQTMWIKFPPGQNAMGDINWTDDVRYAATMKRKYFYLPEIVMHEFGHAMGLWHTSHSPSIMNTPSGNSPHLLPSNHDKHALRNVYKGHVKNH